MKLTIFGSLPGNNLQRFCGAMFQRFCGAADIGSVDPGTLFAKGFCIAGAAPRHTAGVARTEEGGAMIKIDLNGFSGLGAAMASLDRVSVRAEVRPAGEVKILDWDRFPTGDGFSVRGSEGVVINFPCARRDVRAICARAAGDADAAEAAGRASTRRPADMPAWQWAIWCAAMDASR